jgi:hypothetical protein
MTKDSEVLDGTQGAATPEGSNNNAGQPSSATDASVAGTIARLSQQVDALSRQIQSDKDRGVKRVGERVDKLEGDLRQVLQSAMQQGKSVGDLMGDLERQEDEEQRQIIRDLAQVVRSGQFPTKPAGQADSQGVNVSEVLETLELDPTDTRVQAFRAQQFGSLDEAYRQAAALRKSIKTTQPTDADQPSTVSKAPRPAGNQEQLLTEYKEQSKGLYGRPLLLLKQRLREKGLEIS